MVGGGKSGAWEYGGRGDLTGNLDTQKLGLWPGGFLTVELEGDWNNAVNTKIGALLPANTNQLFPIPGGGNVALPNLSFAQFLSHYAGVMLGKVQAVSLGDVNEFAHGKGDPQFFNLGFNVNPTLPVAPYSTLAAGTIVLPTADPDQAMVVLAVLSATGKASTSGFDDFNGSARDGCARTSLASPGINCWVRCIQTKSINKAAGRTGRKRRSEIFGQSPSSSFRAKRVHRRRSRRDNS